MIFAPSSWARPLDWLPMLSAYIAAVPAERDVNLYLDGRSTDVEASTLRAILGRACDHISEGAEFPPVVLLEGSIEAPADAQPVSKPADLAELLDLDFVAPEESAIAITEHALWAKTLVDAIQADLDAATYNAAPGVKLYDVPLVTVRIPTYGSTEALLSRAIPSVLAGPYQKIEVLVCSDGPQPHARAAVESVADPRVRYIELDRRPEYPSWPENFWRTAGTFAVNRLLDEARGAFIAPLDHDDAFTFDHIPLLLEVLAQRDGDFVYGQAMTEFPLGDWRLHGAAPLAYGEVIHATVMYSARLSHMRYDPHAWLLGEPGDWNMWRRMRDAGARIEHVPHPVAVHFKERSSVDHQQQTEEPGPDATATDILGTSARELLNVSSRKRCYAALA
jgi:Glycosyl transferase family 2